MTKDLFSLSSYQYDLPEELIAQYPAESRDHSRLMVIERSSGRIWEMRFGDLIDFLEGGDSLVFNNSKVFPSRLIGVRKGGGKAEVFLTKSRGEGLWEALVRPGRKLPIGAPITFSDEFSCHVLEVMNDGGRLVEFQYKGNFDELLAKHGKVPLPLYIRREPDATDTERYQTVYATHTGSNAAPTAGLHFTHEFLQRLSQKNVNQTHVTLHVGLGTFLPIKTDDIRLHHMHEERYLITSEAAEALNARPKGKRQICVGTTSCRVLESAVTADGKIPSGQFSTNIFIHPPYQFKYVQSLLTNFHLPGSSLLLLVSAFAGYDLVMEAYAKAVKDRYRFFSYGDAMLII